MLRGYAARRARRQQEEKEAADHWRRLLGVFKGTVVAKAGTLSGLVQTLDFTSIEGDAEFHVWWKKSERDQQIREVEMGLEKCHLTPAALGGRRVPAPGEEQTICMWLDAATRSPEAYASAILWTALKSSKPHFESTPSPAAQNALSFMRRNTADELVRAGVPIYSTARTWFLPERFEWKGGPGTEEAMMELIGEAMGSFLTRWAPMHLTVRVDTEKCSPSRF